MSIILPHKSSSLFPSPWVEGNYRQRDYVRKGPMCIWSVVILLINFTNLSCCLLSWGGPPIIC